MFHIMSYLLITLSLSSFVHHVIVLSISGHCPCSKMKMCKLSLGEAQQFYAVHQGKPFYDKLTHFMSAGRIVAMELVRDGKLACSSP